MKIRKLNTEQALERAYEAALRRGSPILAQRLGESISPWARMRIAGEVLTQLRRLEEIKKNIRDTNSIVTEVPVPKFHADMNRRLDNQIRKYSARAVSAEIEFEKAKELLRG